MRDSLAALLLLTAPAWAAPAATPPSPPQLARAGGFPRGNEVFPRLLADPRSTQIQASYYRMSGDDLADVALGHSWGLARWRTGELLQWLWQADIEGLAFSRFKLSGGVNEFQTIDFFANVPLTARRGDVSFKGMLFHESSHLGDDYIRRTNDRGYRYSIDGLRAVAALEPFPILRLYGGGQYLLSTVPSPYKRSAQAGLELQSPELRWSKLVPARLYVAHDLQWHERVRWNMDYRVVGGVKVGFADSAHRAMRLQLGYFDGHSPYGQFFSRREKYTDFSLVFEL